MVIHPRLGPSAASTCPTGPDLGPTWAEGPSCEEIADALQNLWNGATTVNSLSSVGIYSSCSQGKVKLEIHMLVA